MSADSLPRVHPMVTATNLTVVPRSAVRNQGPPVFLIATVTPSTATGTIQFTNGTTALRPPVLVFRGVAHLVISRFAAGTHSLTARYMPPDLTAFGSSSSPPVTLTVHHAHAVIPDDPGTYFNYDNWRIVLGCWWLVGDKLLILACALGAMRKAMRDRSLRLRWREILIRWRKWVESTKSQPAPDLRAVQAQFEKLRSQYAQFECDPLAVLRLPALTDVTVPSTARFVDAFAEAQALDTDTRLAPVDSARFASTVDRAWHTWHAARDAAERIRLAGIPADERAIVERAIKLLTLAHNSDHETERIAAYATVRTELAKLERSGILSLPPAASDALAAASRSELRPSRTTR